MDIDKNAIEEAIIERASDKIVELFCEDRLGDLHSRIQSTLEAVVVKHCDDAVRPVLAQGLNEFVIQRTNEFGERKGNSVTFTEYVTSIAEDWLNEGVDYNGNPVKTDSWSRSKSQTRLVHLLHEHMHHRIETAMKDAVKTVVENVAPAIATTCKVKIEEATKDIRRAMGK